METKFANKARKMVHTRMNEAMRYLTPHYIMPGYNLHARIDSLCFNAESIAEMYTPYPYNCDLPKPLLPGAPLNRTVLNGEDPALQLLRTKNYIEKKMKQVTEPYRIQPKEIKMPKKNDLKYTNAKGKTVCTVPAAVAQLAELVDADPDPYFSGYYNWYYTGGTLQHVKLNNEDVLIFPYSSELVATPITPRMNSIWKPTLDNASKCSLDGTLYDLKYCTVNDISYVLGRFKHHCIFYRLTNVKDKLELFEIHTQTSNLPLVSADMHPTNPNLYATVNVEKAISLWDLTKVNAIVTNVVQNQRTLDDNWASLKYDKFDNNLLVYCDRHCVYYLDTRTSLSDPVLTLCPKNRLDVCDDICLNVASHNENCNYIGTLHSFLMLDKRLKKDYVTQKWTHQFRSAPLFADICKRNGEDVLAFSSQLPNESAIIINTWTSEDKSFSRCLPYRLPSILKSFYIARTMGKCLDPLTRRRLHLSNTGCSLISNDQGSFYFVQNSIGDVFYQCVTHTDNLDINSDENCRAIEALDQWEQHALRRKNAVKPLVLTEKTNMKRVYDHLTNTKLKWERNRDQKEEERWVKEERWKQPLSKLATYADLLASDLLKMWEVSEDPIVPLSAAPHQKVLNWLGTSTDKMEVSPERELLSQPLTSQQSNFFSEVNTQELMSVSQNVNPNPVQIKKAESYSHEIVDPEEQFLPTVTIRSRQNQKRKRNQFAGL